VTALKPLPCRSALQGLLLAVLLMVLPPAAAEPSGEAVEHLKAHGRPPAEYVLARLRDHRAVLLGEAHWLRHDVQLVIDLVPRLREAGADVLALEILPAGEQSTIDRVVAGGEWDAEAAVGVLRKAAWPYREYLEILRAVWKHNRGQPPARHLKLVALGPGTDWRERLLPRSETYDQFMARIVLDLLQQPGRRALVYSGLHHAFTRYHQPELPREQRVERFLDRMGNILWREAGEEVFLIALAAPWPCRERTDGPWTRCLPVGGAIDCAAAALGRPAGFDVIGSPFAGLPITRAYSYAQGYPDLRLEDLTDGFIWTRPIEEYQGVGLIPLSEFAPDPASLAEVAGNNPFSDDKGLGRADLEKLWQEEAERLREILRGPPADQRFARWRDAGGQSRGRNPPSPSRPGLRGSSLPPCGCPCRAGWRRAPASPGG
jgi:hypothetical protein